MADLVLEMPYLVSQGRLLHSLKDQVKEHYSVSGCVVFNIA